MIKKILIVCTTDSMIWNFLIPHIYSLQERGYIVECACSKTGFYFEEMECKHNITVHELHVVRSPFNFNNIRAIYELVKIIKEGSFDNIFCHEPMGGVIGRVSAKICGISVCYMAHGFHFYNGSSLASKLIYYPVEYLLSYVTDVLITINKEDYAASQKLHSKLNMLTHGIGVNTQKFQKDMSYQDFLNQEHSLTSDTIKILNVGELIKRKNHEVIIRALAMLPNNYHLFIAGDGILKDNLYKLCLTLDIKDRVHFLGFRKDIKKLCCSSDLFVFPSIQEGLSIALMEAMGCGLPVVASNIRGNNDLIIDKKGGILISKNEPKEYAKAILDISHDSDKRNNTAQFNKEYIKNFDIQVVEEELKQIYHGVL